MQKVDELLKVNKLLVVGLGLIGGSVALAARRAGFANHYLGVDLAYDERQGALSLGVVDQASASLAELAPDADLILLAVPVLAMEPVLAALKPHLKPTAVVTDVGSAKAVVLEAAKKVFNELPARLVLGHPIAGAEKSGVLASKVDLFVGRTVILTPTENNAAEAIGLVKQLWQACGAEVIEMDVKKHDQVLARTSHLPHLLAFSLVETLARKDERLEIFRYAAGGFRDFTRVAASDPVMWRDIFLANRDATLEALDEFMEGVERLKTAVESQDAEALVSSFTRAKSARDYFTALLNETGYQTMQTTTLNFITQPGAKTIKGTIRVPGDKSISHRSIMLGALAEGTTQVKGFLEGEDALATLQTFRDMGVLIEGPHNGQVTIHGVGMHGLKKPQGPLYLGNSGTTMRLLAGLLAAQPFDTELTGDASLSKRPMNRVADPLRLMGAEIATADQGRPPLKITGGKPLKGINYDLPMASAQVKSCLLLAGLWAEGETQVTEPAPTRDHTERMLKGFGYTVSQAGATVSLTGGGKLTATEIDIPADISSATFFMVAAAIMPGSDLTLEHVGINPTRDGVINILRLMGADLELSNQREVGGEPVADIRVRYAPLKGIAIPEDQVPLAIDEFPVLFIAAACAEGVTTLSGAEELRVKESDRIQVMADGLLDLGVECTVLDDGIQIIGKGEQAEVFGSAEIICHHDHRIAMSFAVAGLRASGNIHIKDCAVVNTSFPGFAELMNNVGGKLLVEQK
ncbi:bifunctional prephenate dehydrogenase/3-phosphoshikimate 1-carboxyvinyltransferase [Marinospirillum insulare]|nr:bifunctional prephenate dehydrogenase/3-phosphoshikimate 1-carboxyvinyltransferase [Marinospirillum insulare]